MFPNKQLEAVQEIMPINWKGDRRVFSEQEECLSK
jgi:hypothetical protein